MSRLQIVVKCSSLYEFVCGNSVQALRVPYHCRRLLEGKHSDIGWEMCHTVAKPHVSLCIEITPLVGSHVGKLFPMPHNICMCRPAHKVMASEHRYLYNRYTGLTPNMILIPRWSINSSDTAAMPNTRKLTQLQCQTPAT